MIGEIGLRNTGKELTSELKELHLPTEKALLVVDIQNKLNDGLLEYASAAQDIYESFSPTHLNIYIKLLDRNDDSKHARQKSLLLDFLNHVKPSLNTTQMKLKETSAEFKASIEILAVIPVGQSTKGVCDHLKDRYAKISAVIDESIEKLKEKTRVIEELTSQIQKETVNPTTADYAELCDKIIQLIADCNEYRQKHSNSLA